MVRPATYLLLLIIASIFGCKGSSPVAIETVEYSILKPGYVKIQNPSKVTLSGSLDRTGAYLSNGKIGLRIGKTGLLAAKSVTYFSSDAYQPNGEEQLIPGAFTLKVQRKAGSSQLAEKVIGLPIQRIEQNLDVFTQVLTTDIYWANQDRYYEQVSLSNSRSLQVTARFYSSGSQKPTSVFNQPNSMIFEAGEVTFEKDKRIVSGQLSENADKLILNFEESKANERLKFTAFTNLKDQASIQIEGDQEQQAIFNYYSGLLASSVNAITQEEPNPPPLGPFGLSSSDYFGHQFWDADIWMLPALKLTFPERAASIGAYRESRLEGARKGYSTWVNEKRPIGKGELANQNAKPFPGAIKFPWESSVSGEETVPGPSRYQDHISASVVFGLEQLEELGLFESTKLQEIGKGVANYYRDRIELTKENTFSLRGTMSPDEHFIGDNDLYTNILVERLLRKYGPPNQKPLKANRARKGKQLLTYEGDQERGYKQAAAVLAIWPLNDPEALAQASNMMERFPPKVTKNGPAMSGSIDATIFARLGKPQKALEILNQEIKDYCDEPFFLPSEKRSRSKTVFLTGIAGYLNVLYYGFCGIDLVPFSSNIAEPFIKLKSSNKAVIFRPNLPETWKSLTVSLTIEEKKYKVKMQKSGLVEISSN